MGATPPPPPPSSPHGCTACRSSQTSTVFFSLPLSLFIFLSFFLILLFSGRGGGVGKARPQTRHCSLLFYPSFICPTRTDNALVPLPRGNLPVLPPGVSKLQRLSFSAGRFSHDDTDGSGPCLRWLRALASACCHVIRGPLGKDFSGLDSEKVSSADTRSRYRATVSCPQFCPQLLRRVDCLLSPAARPRCSASAWLEQGGRDSVEADVALCKAAWDTLSYMNTVKVSQVNCKAFTPLGIKSNQCFIVYRLYLD